MTKEKQYTCNITMKVFKHEYRLVCCDTWGTAMEAWFEAAGQMWWRGIHIPYEWEYRPAMPDPREEESYFHDLFEECSDEILVEIGNFLFRYCQYLKFKGVDY